MSAKSHLPCEVALAGPGDQDVGVFGGSFVIQPATVGDTSPYVGFKEPDDTEVGRSWLPT